MKGTILNDAIPEELQPKIVELSIAALKKHTTDKDAASEIKNALEETKPYNEKGFGTWNVVVGHHFASSLTFED